MCSRDDSRGEMLAALFFHGTLESTGLLLQKYIILHTDAFSDYHV